MSGILEWYRNGGPIMHFILLVGIIGLAVFLERLYFIVIKSKVNGRAFIERVIQLVRAGKTEDAIKLCAQSKAALPDMGLLILRSRTRAVGHAQRVAAQRAERVEPCVSGDEPAAHELVARQDRRPEVVIVERRHEEAPVVLRHLPRAHRHDLRRRDLAADLDRLLSAHRAPRALLRTGLAGAADQQRRGSRSQHRARHGRTPARRAHHLASLMAAATRMARPPWLSRRSPRDADGASSGTLPSIAWRARSTHRRAAASFLSASSWSAFSTSARHVVRAAS